MFTALIIAALIVAGAATAVGGGMYVAARKRRALPGGGSPKLLGSGSYSDLAERSFSAMREGDVVMWDARDFIVEGVIHYDEAGHRWSMGRIVDGDSAQWLLVGLERTGGDSKKLLAQTDEVELGGYPSEFIVIGQEKFGFDKRGTATATLSGNTGTLGGQKNHSAHRCRWWNYSAPGGKTLLIEQWGDDYRALVGSTVKDSEIEFMPGS